MLSYYKHERPSEKGRYAQGDHFLGEDDQQDDDQQDSSDTDIHDVSLRTNVENVSGKDLALNNTGRDIRGVVEDCSTQRRAHREGGR